MRTRTILVAAALLSAACSGAAGPQRESRIKSADRKAIMALIEAKAAIARRAWEARDARIMIPDSSTVSIRSPDGNMISPSMRRDALQSRMDGVSHIDTMAIHVDSFVVVTNDSILAYSTQRFVRTLRRADGYERKRFSVVNHEQPFKRRAGEWVVAAPEKEINPRSWWEDEGPPTD